MSGPAICRIVLETISGNMVETIQLISSDNNSGKVSANSILVCLVIMFCSNVWNDTDLLAVEAKLEMNASSESHFLSVICVTLSA